MPIFRATSTCQIRCLIPCEMPSRFLQDPIHHRLPMQFRIQTISPRFLLRPLPLVWHSLFSLRRNECSRCASFGGSAHRFSMFPRVLEIFDPTGIQKEASAQILWVRSRRARQDCASTTIGWASKQQKKSRKIAKLAG